MKTHGTVDVYVSSEPVVDLYTVVWKVGKNRYFFAMGDDPYSPQGFNQFVGSGKKYKCGKHLGYKMPFIPMHLVRAIQYRITP